MTIPFLDYTFWPAGTSLATSLASRPVPKPKLSNFGVTINVANASGNTGTFLVQGTNDNPFNMDGSAKASGPEWFDIGITGMTISTGSEKFEPNINQIAWAYIRFIFTQTGSAVGTVTGKLHGQGL